MIEKKDSASTQGKLENLTRIEDRELKIQGLGGKRTRRGFAATKTEVVWFLTVFEIYIDAIFDRVSSRARRSSPAAILLFCSHFLSPFAVNGKRACAGLAGGRCSANESRNYLETKNNANVSQNAIIL